MSDYSSDEEHDFRTEPMGYLYEPEYTDEELYQMEVARAEREREMASTDVEGETGAAAARPRVTDTRWCTCLNCEVMQTEVECYCCHEWDLVMPRMQDLSIDEELHGASASVCITNNNDLPAILNAGVLETFFHVPKINWKKRPKPAGPDGQLSAEQYRLVAYRIIMEWALKGQTLGPGNRRVLPSCVVALIRRTYPSPNGQYAGFKETNDALQLF